MGKALVNKHEKALLDNLCHIPEGFFSDRTRDILLDRKAGWTMSMIGTKFGISTGRVRQIVEKALRRGLHPRGPLPPLIINQIRKRHEED